VNPAKSLWDLSQHCGSAFNGAVRQMQYRVRSTGTTLDDARPGAPQLLVKFHRVIKLFEAARSQQFRQGYRVLNRNVSPLPMMRQHAVRGVAHQHNAAALPGSQGPDREQAPAETVRDRAYHFDNGFTADLILEHWPPRDQAEAEPIIDHGKSAAGQLRRLHKLSAYGLALFERREGKTPLSGELAAGPLHFLQLKGRDKIDSWPPRAVDCSRGMALPDQLGGAPIKSLTDLDAESAHDERTLIAANEPPIEPCRAVAFHLLVKIAAGENAYAGRTGPASIVDPGANLEIFWDEPAIGAGPLDNAGAAQRLQAPHMGVNETLIKKGVLKTTCRQTLESKHRFALILPSTVVPHALRHRFLDHDPKSTGPIALATSLQADTPCNRRAEALPAGGPEATQDLASA
jgi:hypothetical protein